MTGTNPYSSDVSNSFTSYFGTKLHGAEITWYNDPTASDTDQTELKIEYKQYLMSTLYALWDSTNTNDSAWFEGQWALDSDFTCDSGALSTGDCTFDRSAFGNTAAGVDVANWEYIFHMQIANPVASASPDYDGFYAIAGQTITFADDGSNPSSIVTWVGADATGAVDLAPQSDFDLTTDLDQLGDGANCDGTVTSISSSSGTWTVTDPSGTNNMCTEFWNIGEEAGACVIVTGYMKRMWDAPDDDTACDIGLDYVSHTISVQIGPYAAGVAAADTMRFSQDVDF